MNSQPAPWIRFLPLSFPPFSVRCDWFSFFSHRIDRGSRTGARLMTVLPCIYSVPKSWALCWTILHCSSTCLIRASLSMDHQTAVYHLQYATTGRAKCRGNFATCNRSLIDKGTLRLGADFGPGTAFGDDDTKHTLLWYHWGCAPKKALAKISNTGAEHVAGFSWLRFEDQERVKAAIENLKPVNRAPAHPRPTNTKAVTPAKQATGSVPDRSQPSSSTANKSRKRKANVAEQPPKEQAATQVAGPGSGAKHAADGSEPSKAAAEHLDVLVRRFRLATEKKV
ncbi:hypothetical protein CALVIDRAFT_385874 [Calocera viscosa TUFC12733]|uniref:PARP-type domain-containing protein n=1 Tax=Calocera viscosa (strain TUFC12733) TaxID=1330018 RepID=A0A167GN03_CALVF|nr:hypothetical protein CALVIDRAFT_385874 [Calocera viscosa TUFC12733]